METVDYARIASLAENINEENALKIPLDDLRLVAICQKYHIELLRKEKTSLQGKLSNQKKTKGSALYTDVPNFIAIDFETATTNRMACSLGIVVVKDYQICQELQYLIQPPGNKYDQSCINVHGIIPSDTEYQPTFDKIWLSIRHHFDLTTVAHNIAFDLDVLRVNCNYYNIDVPDICTVCTCELHNRTNLLNLCELYDIKINNHHNALEDARACAKVFIKYQQIHNLTSSLQKPVTKAKKERDKDYFSDPTRELSRDVKQQDLSIVKNPDNYFYNKKVVITGVFESFPVRQDLANRLKQLGADINGSISRKTDIVICGEDYGPAKIEKVSNLNADGCNIEIMDEKELQEKLSII